MLVASTPDADGWGRWPLSAAQGKWTDPAAQWRCRHHSHGARAHVGSGCCHLVLLLAACAGQPAGQGRCRSCLLVATEHEPSSQPFLRSALPQHQGRPARLSICPPSYLPTASPESHAQTRIRAPQAAQAAGALEPASDPALAWTPMRLAPATAHWPRARLPGCLQGCRGWTQAAGGSTCHS